MSGGEIRNVIVSREKWYALEAENAKLRTRGTILEAACRALAEKSIYEDDGEVTCNVCGCEICDGDRVEFTGGNDQVMNAEHEGWCPVPLALRALKGTP